MWGQAEVLRVSGSAPSSWVMGSWPSWPAGPWGLVQLHRMESPVSDTLGGHAPLALRQGLLGVACPLGGLSLLAPLWWEGTVSYLHLPTRGATEGL